MPSRARSHGAVLFSVSKFSDPAERRMARERLAILKQLVDEGYRVVLPHNPTFGDSAYYDRARQRGARVLKRGFGSDNWVRDAWSEFGRHRVLNHSARPRGTLPISDLGEGGGTIPLNAHTVLVQHQFVTHDPRQVQALQKKGFTIHVLPDPMQKRGSSRLPHIDLAMGLVASKRLLVVDPAYYAQARHVLDALIAKYRLKKVIVPRSETAFLPANFLVLPDGRVLMHPHAKTTMAILRQHGVRVIEAASDMKANLKFMGGARCMARTLGKNVAKN